MQNCCGPNLGIIIVWIQAIEGGLTSILCGSCELVERGSVKVYFALSGWHWASVYRGLAGLVGGFLWVLLDQVL